MLGILCRAVDLVNTADGSDFKVNRVNRVRVRPLEFVLGLGCQTDLISIRDQTVNNATFKAKSYRLYAIVGVLLFRFFPLVYVQILNVVFYFLI